MKSTANLCLRVLPEDQALFQQDAIGEDLQKSMFLPEHLK
jgi:hypothetical protein